MQQTCDPDRLDAFVRGELSEQQESELTAHLDQCASCGEELERRVAAADQWREAGELLTQRTRRSNVMDLANDPSTSGGFTTSTTFAEQMDQVVSMLAPTDDPEMLGRIGGYEVSGVIGCGGMGVVFKAHDRSLDRVVAIKVMAPHLAGSGAARKRFARESKAAAAVLHPNVIAIHCVADDPKLPYLVMPYIGGASLQKRVEADGPLCTQDTLRIGQQIAAGLAAAHAQGLVHRDIKPANILLERGVERVTITDFGLARAVDDATMTRSGVIAGTPQYMSPEQARGESIDHRSDLFSLGSVLYMMCAGHSPFRAETTFGILRRITDNQPRPLREINPDVPEWLCAIIEKLHAKEPSERFQSAEEVAELLEDCLAHVQQPTAIPLPISVEQLSQLLPIATTALEPAKKQLRQLFYNLPPIAKYIAAAAGAIALFFAGILIVLELDKGTLTIESELDNVPIRIMQGDEVVKSLTVSKEGAMTRIGAGKYIVEIGQEFDKAVIKDGGVELSRGATAIVKVTQTNTNTAADEKAKDEAAKAWLRRPVVGSTHDGKSFQLAGHDALMHSVMTNNSEALNRLLTMDKYDLDFSPSNGSWTLLQTALLHECLETTSLLLQHGAKPTFASKGTPLPIEIAKRSGRPELVLLVQEYIIALDNADPQTKEDESKEPSQALELDNNARGILQGFTGDWKLNAISFDGGKFRNVLRSKMSATIRGTFTGSNLEMFIGSQQIGPAYKIGFLDASITPMQITLNRYGTFQSLINFEDEVLTLARPIRPGEPRPQSLQPAKGIVIYRWTRMSEQAHDRDSFVTIPLKAEWVPEDWLKRNIGRRHLTIVADGNIQDEAKPNVVNRVQRGILHECRLESYEKTSRAGVEYWNARFFVPRKPVYSIGALWFKDAIDTYRIGDRHTPVPSPDLTQDNPQVKLDEALAEGHSFRLDDANEDDGAIQNSSSHTNNLIGTWKPHSATEKTWHSDDIRMAHEKLERPQSNPHIDKWTLSFTADGAARFTGIEHYLGAGPESPRMTLDTWLTREFDFQGKWDLREGMLSIITNEPAVKQWKLIALTESQLVLHHETGILKVVDGKRVPETVDVVWVKQTAKSEAIISDAAVTVPPMEFETLEDFLKPGRELFDKEMKQIDERLAKVVEGSAEHSLLTTKKKQLQQQWDLSVAQVKGMAAAAKAGKSVQLAPIVIPNNSRPWQAPMPDPLLGHDEDIAKVLAGTWQVKRYVAGGEEAPLDGATVTFSKNMWVMHFKLGDEEGDIKQVYRIGNDKIDIWDTDSGPDIRTALPYLGSYSLENDTLRICYHGRAMELETPQSRPPVQPGKGFVYLELQRRARAMPNNTQSAIPDTQNELDAKLVPLVSELADRVALGSIKTLVVEYEISHSRGAPVDLSQIDSSFDTGSLARYSNYPAKLCLDRESGNGFFSGEDVYKFQWARNDTQGKRLVHDKDRNQATLLSPNDITIRGQYAGYDKRVTNPFFNNRSLEDVLRDLIRGHDFLDEKSPKIWFRIVEDTDSLFRFEVVDHAVLEKVGNEISLEDRERVAATFQVNIDRFQVTLDKRLNWAMTELVRYGCKSGQEGLEHGTAEIGVRIFFADPVLLDGVWLPRSVRDFSGYDDEVILMELVVTHLSANAPEQMIDTLEIPPGSRVSDGRTLNEPAMGLAEKVKVAPNFEDKNSAKSSSHPAETPIDTNSVEWPPSGFELTEQQIQRVIGAQSARIVRALDTPVDLVVDGKSSLAEIVSGIVREHRISVRLNEKSFEEQGVAIHHVPAFEIHGVTLKSALTTLLEKLLQHRSITPVIEVRHGVLTLAAKAPSDTTNDLARSKPTSVVFQLMGPDKQALPETVVEVQGSDGVYFVLSDQNGLAPVVGHGVSNWYTTARDTSGQLMAYTSHGMFLSKPTKPYVLNFTAPRSLAVNVSDEHGRPIEGATVGILAERCRFQVTDATGRAEFTLPVNNQYVQAIFALKSGKGLDYISYQPQWATDLPRELSLQLVAARELKVRLLDEQNQPLKGVPIFPVKFDFLNTEEPKAEKSLSWWKLAMGAVNWSATNEQGEVVFDWLPRDQAISFVTTNRELEHNTLNVTDLAEDVVEFRMLGPVKVSGRVLDIDGKPVAGASIAANNESGASANTDEEGRYVLKVRPGSTFYLEAVDSAGGGWMAKRRGISDWVEAIAGQPSKNNDVVIRPTARVFGRVTYTFDSAPAANIQLSYQFHGPPGRDRIEFKPGAFMSRGYVINGYTDDDGRFEFYAVPGKYTVKAVPDSGLRAEQEFAVIGTEPHEANMAISKTIPVKGRVIAGDPPIPIGRVTIQRKHLTDPFGCSGYDWSTNEAGELDQNYRDRDPMILWGHSEDKQLWGVTDMAWDDAEFEMKLAPRAEMKIRILDSDQKPVANTEFTYGIFRRVQPQYQKEENRQNINVHSIEPREGTTDENGILEIKDLIVGGDYMIHRTASHFRFVANPDSPIAQAKILADSMAKDVVVDIALMNIGLDIPIPE